MCSTPRPKSTIKGQKKTTGGILSNMSAEARAKFADNANQAEQRRQQRLQRQHMQLRLIHNHKQSAKQAKPSLWHWLFHTSISELVALFLTKKA